MKPTHAFAAVLSILASSCACTRQSPDKVAPVPTSEPPVSIAPPVVAPPAPAVTLDSPYRGRMYVFKGQLHAHTTNSDGKQSPAAVVAAYQKAGYDFIAVTDHNWNTRDPRVPGILFVPGVENDHSCQHENRINATTAANGVRAPQDVIDQARFEGSFVIINHPDWPGSYPADPCWSDQALLGVSRYDAIEAWNASDEPKNRNAETRIDMLLSAGRRTNLVAVDDCHDVHASYCMTSSVSVFADARTVPDIMANLKAGNFYASSGAEISLVHAAEGAVNVYVPAKSDIEFIGDKGRTMKMERAVLSSSYAATGDERYVRARVTRPDGRMAWTNPIYVSKQ